MSRWLIIVFCSIFLLAIGSMAVAQIFFVIENWKDGYNIQDWCIGIALGLCTLALFIICLLGLIYGK